MTLFDDKEKAAENKYAHDQEMQFKVHARAHKLVGVWAAGKLGLSGENAEKYASAIVEGFLKNDTRLVFEKIKSDFAGRSVVVSDHDIHAEIHRLEHLAQEQVIGN